MIFYVVCGWWVFRVPFFAFISASADPEVVPGWAGTQTRILVGKNKPGPGTLFWPEIFQKILKVQALGCVPLDWWRANGVKIQHLSSWDHL